MYHLSDLKSRLSHYEIYQLKNLHHIYLINEDKSFNQRIGTLLKESGYQVTECEDTKSFLKSELIASPSVILMNLELPNESALKLQTNLNKLIRKIPIIFFGSQNCIASVVDGFRNGAKNFIFKNLVDKEIILVLENIFTIKKNHIQKCLRRDEYLALVNTLTTREKEIYEHLLLGEMSKDIATTLHISDATIKMHKSHILKKMKVSSSQMLTNQKLINV